MNDEQRDARIGALLDRIRAAAERRDAGDHGEAVREMNEAWLEFDSLLVTRLSARLFRDARDRIRFARSTWAMPGPLPWRARCYAIGAWRSAQACVFGALVWIGERLGLVR